MAIREIIFRGKRVDNGEWVEGYYVSISETYHYILTGNPVVEPGKIDVEHYKVIPETVGQYTGLTDKNGKRIFEGDIIQSVETGGTGIFQWFPEHSAFMVWCISSNEIGFLYECSSIMEVIGNIHDNKELLKGE